MYVDIYVDMDVDVDEKQTFLHIYAYILPYSVAWLGYVSV